MRFFIPITFLLVFGSCAPSRFVKPLDKDQNAISASYGGALIEVPGVATMPIPFTTLTYGRGLNGTTTVFGSWHTTSALFGTFQTDFGMLHESWRREDGRMSLTATFAGNLAIDRWERNLKFWPQVDANFYWIYKGTPLTRGGDVTIDVLPKRNYLYGGVSNWFELSKTRVHDQEQPTRWLLNPHIGHTFERSKWDFQTEFKFIAPYASNENLVVNYFSPFGKRGGFGFFVGVTRKF